MDVTESLVDCVGVCEAVLDWLAAAVGDAVVVSDTLPDGVSDCEGTGVLDSDTDDVAVCDSDGMLVGLPLTAADTVGVGDSLAADDCDGDSVALSDSGISELVADSDTVGVTESDALASTESLAVGVGVDEGLPAAVSLADTLFSLVNDSDVLADALITLGSDGVGDKDGVRDDVVEIVGVRDDV